ncbi:TetR-like C-terminal domain-containing protein [Embleya sp. MST-111070]|uniref:TetR-like C-terminal domain-containing protein n=1 Tax=Embleya sp. MST-111070 TaxID=3398231 RepID=UPI003F7360ED
MATIYRRWRTVEGLIVDLLTWISFNEIPFPDTGSLEGDLRALSRSIVALYRDDIRFRTMIETIVAGATRDSAAERALHDFFAERNAGAAVIVERAIARGELPPETDGIELIARAGGAGLLPDARRTPITRYRARRPRRGRRPRRRPRRRLRKHRPDRCHAPLGRVFK